MPEHRHPSSAALNAFHAHFRVSKSQKVEHERIDDLVGKGIFFIQQHPDKQRCRSCIVHFRKMEQGRGRMQNGDGYSCQDR